MTTDSTKHQDIKCTRISFSQSGENLTLTRQGLNDCYFTHLVEPREM